MAPDPDPSIESLFEQLCQPVRLGLGYADVRRNDGAPGIDGVSVKAFGEQLDEQLQQLATELANWQYQPQPVRRVELDKPDGGTRVLGIPCVRDRVVQATLKRLLEPLVTPTFSDHSFGFIPGRNQGQAVQEARRIIVEEEKPWVVDIDLSKFFDRIQHDRLISRLKQHTDDTRILRVIGMTLRSGIMQDGLVTATPEGAVQGSPLSPLLSNVVLDELDKELEARGLSFCRFADDCNIFVRTPKAAERVMDSVSRFIERQLRLVVNRDKSQVARSEQVKFLGMTIVDGHVAISAVSMKRAMAMVKHLTPRGTHLRLNETVAAINRWYRGWSSYYSLTEYPSQLARIEAHIRRRLRARLIGRFRLSTHLARDLLRRGASVRPVYAAIARHDKRWALSRSFAVSQAYPNRWFTFRLGLFIRSTAGLPHWYAPDRRVRLLR